MKWHKKIQRQGIRLLLVNQVHLDVLSVMSHVLVFSCKVSIVLYLLLSLEKGCGFIPWNWSTSLFSLLSCSWRQVTSTTLIKWHSFLLEKQHLPLLILQLPCRSGMPLLSSHFPLLLRHPSLTAGNRRIGFPLLLSMILMSISWRNTRHPTNNTSIILWRSHPSNCFSLHLIISG